MSPYFPLLHPALLLAGTAHFGILIASALTPRVLDWRRELQLLPPLLRRLFWVYGVFIVMTIAALGLLTIRFAPAMAEGQPVARGVAAFAAVFWGTRLIVQLLVFDARPYLTHAWLKAGYHLLTAAFAYLTLTYSYAAFQPNPPHP